MKHIAIYIEYAGLTLPVVKNESGAEVVPLKPIVDMLGIQWERQRKKIGNSEFQGRFLGACTVHLYGAGDQKRDQICIRLDRVAAFLMGLSADQIRAQGNAERADFLEAKLTEWADALHDYETFGSAHNPRHADALLAMRRANAIANVAKIKDAALRRIALAEIGINLDAPAPTATPASSGDLFQNENL